MVAQLKTITSVTEKGLDEIKKAIASGTSSADLTKEIHYAKDEIIRYTTATWQVMQGRLDAAQADLHNLITAVGNVELQAMQGRLDVVQADLHNLITAVGGVELQAIQKMLSEVQGNLLQAISTVEGEVQNLGRAIQELKQSDDAPQGNRPSQRK
jgi:hypothetical protein